MSTFVKPPDLAQITLAKSSDINAITAAVKTAFDLLPSEAALQQGKVNYAVSTGTANNYVVALSNTIVTYEDGLLVSFRPLNSNTGASTINVNSMGAKSIRLTGGEALSAGDINAGVPIDVRYSSVTGFFHLTPNSTKNAQTSTAQAVIATAQAVIATTQASNALNSANAAASSQGAASSSATLAQDWAIKTSSPVSGSDFGAKKYADDAAIQAGLATTNGAAQVTLATTQANNAASSATTATTQASNSANSATAASTSASNAATSASNALNSYSLAATSATSASNANTAASTSATNAAASATAASNSAISASASATTATSQATISTTKAVEASNSATNSATSAASAATLLANAGSMLGINFGAFTITDGELTVTHLSTSTPSLSNGELILTYETL